MLVNFDLLPVAQIKPWWNATGELSLHWYGLTLGRYWLDLGGVELFRLHDEYLARWARTAPGEFDGPYDTYQVARLHDDLLEMLPAALDPVPSPVAARLRPPDQWRTWLDRGWRRLESFPDEDPTGWDVFYRAMGWWGKRHLDAGYLVSPPRLSIWREDQTVLLRWDNRDHVSDGIPVWQATAGEISLPVAEFVAEIESFHTRLIAAMEERLREVRSHWPHPDVVLDIEEMERDHARRASLFPADPYLPTRPTDWDDVMQALRHVDAEWGAGAKVQNVPEYTEQDWQTSGGVSEASWARNRS